MAKSMESLEITAGSKWLQRCRDSLTAAPVGDAKIQKNRNNNNKRLDISKRRIVSWKKQQYKLSKMKHRKKYSQA